MTSTPVYTSRAEGFRTAEEIAALRPVASPKPKRAKTLRRERMDASHTFFCRNANCDHVTWSPVDQARHMHAEFVWAMEALVMRAPESPEALLLSGGVVLAELTDDECREAVAWRHFYVSQEAAVPVDVQLRAQEYERRARYGLAAKAGTWKKRTPRQMCRKGLHPWIPENIMQKLTGDQCRLCWRAAQSAGRAEIRKLHVAGDHSRCVTDRCAAARRAAGMNDSWNERARERARKKAEAEGQPDGT